jgi:hypothetical protein
LISSEEVTVRKTDRFNDDRSQIDMVDKANSSQIRELAVSDEANQNPA